MISLAASLPTGLVLPTGLMLPESVLHTDEFKILATFVALNTVMYVTLAVVKILPRPDAPAWFTGRNRRTQDRSIVPAPGPGSSH